MSDRIEPNDGVEMSALHDQDEGRSLVDDIVALFDDGKTYASAELAYQKSRMSYAAERGKAILVYGGLALCFIFFALMALVVGAVIALSHLVGPVWATLIVVIVLLGFAALSLATARGRIRQVKDVFEDDENG